MTYLPVRGRKDAQIITDAGWRSVSVVIVCEVERVTAAAWCEAVWQEDGSWQVRTSNGMETTWQGATWTDANLSLMKWAGTVERFHSLSDVPEHLMPTCLCITDRWAKTDAETMPRAIF